MSTIEELRAQHPNVFELIDVLRGKIAEAESSMQEDLQRLRSYEASRDQLNDRYASFRSEIEPMQKQIDAMARAIGEIATPTPMVFVPEPHTPPQQD